MSKFVRWMIVPVVAVLAACGGQSDAERLDEALTRDLALAASMQYPQQQFMSPMEMGYGQYPPGQYPQQMYGQYPQPVYGPPAAQQAIYRAPAPARRTTASTGTTVRREPVRHTKRDALIGATAGAVIGAVISKDAKGALIGAAAGGLLGGVVGHTIDVQH